MYIGKKYKLSFIYEHKYFWQHKQDQPMVIQMRCMLFAIFTLSS